MSISNTTLPEEFKDLLDEMSLFSWKLLQMVPPLVSETIPDTPFRKEWHAKEEEPEWNEDIVDYQLVYYRPILFFSYKGKVSQKGWVGNVERMDDLEKCSDGSGDRVKLKHGHTSYKKPRLKVQGSGDTVVASEQASSGSVPNVPVVMKQLKQYSEKEELSKKDTGNYYFGLRKL